MHSPRIKIINAAYVCSDRYMHGRGNSKRHTLALGSAEEVQEVQRKMQQQQPQQQQQPIRTRRTGLHTVMERPPGKHLCLSAVYKLRGFNVFFFCRCHCVVVCILYYPIKC
jgi:hypothetical protein